MYEKFYVCEKILHTRNCRRKFIKNLLPEKRTESMQTKQPRFKSRLNNAFDNLLISVHVHLKNNALNYRIIYP